MAALVPLTWPWLRSCGERKCNFCISSFRQSSKQAGRLSPGKKKKAGQGLRTPPGLRVTPTQCRLLRESQRELSLGRICPRGGSSSLQWGAHTDQWDVAPLGWDVTTVPVRNSSKAAGHKHQEPLTPGEAAPAVMVLTQFSVYKDWVELDFKNWTCLEGDTPQLP